MRDTITIIVDSCSTELIQIMDMNNASVFIWQITLGEIITIILAIIGTIVAIHQYKSSKKDTWFLNVIVLPQLEPIKEFYLSLLNNLDCDKSDITKCRSCPHDEFILKLATIQDNRKREINNFFDHIIALVRSYDRDLGNRVSDVIMQLEDKYVYILNTYSNNMDVKEREIILENEQRLLEILNSTMTKK